jgi:hypothetical protein
MRANILLLIVTILGVGVAMAATNEVHAQGGCGNDTQKNKVLIATVKE